MSRQRIAITGSSGLIGSALSAALTARGDDVVHLVRRSPRSGNEIRWDPARHEVDRTELGHLDAAVNLAGAGIADQRWDAQYKDVLRRSRIDSTATLSAALAGSDEPVRLVNGSAIGAYGDRGEEHLEESSPFGTGFLAELVQDWEAAAAPAVQAGCPTAYARTGLVLCAQGGPLQRMLPLARLGLSGPLGTGRQWWSWISLVDEVRALMHLVDHPEIAGPVNLVAPQPQRQAQIAATLGRLLRRPAVLPAPKFALRAVLGEFAEDITSSQRLTPAVLTEHGFTWTHPTPESALRWVLDSSDHAA